MRRSEVEAIVVEHLPRLAQSLGLSSWEITLGYEDQDVDADGHLTRGECTRLVDYQSAHISLNPSGFRDAEQVLCTLRHELFHVVISPFDLYQAGVERVNLQSPVAELLDRIWQHSAERSVAALERMWQGLTTSTIDPSL